MTVAIPEAIGALDSAAGAVAAPAAARAAVPARSAPTRYLGRPPSSAPPPRTRSAPKVFVAPTRASHAAGRGAPQAMHGRGRAAPSAGTAHKLVVAEFILCVLLVGITPIVMKKPGKDGHLYVPNDFVRLSAICLLFFVLALLSNSPKSSRVAAAFGGLVTMGVVYNASQSLTALGSIFVSSTQDKGMVRTAAAGTQTIQTPEYTPVNLGKNPSDFGGPAGTGAARV